MTSQPSYFFPVWAVVSDMSIPISQTLAVLLESYSRIMKCVLTSHLKFSLFDVHRSMVLDSAEVTDVAISDTISLLLCCAL